MGNSCCLALKSYGCAFVTFMLFLRLRTKEEECRYIFYFMCTTLGLVNNFKHEFYYKMYILLQITRRNMCNTR